MLKSDQERNFKLGQDQQDDPVAKIAKINRKFETEQSERVRLEIARTIIDEQKRQKIQATSSKLIDMMTGGREGQAQHAINSMSAEEVDAIVENLAERGGDMDREKPLTPEAQKIVDDVMAKK